MDYDCTSTDLEDSKPSILPCFTAWEGTSISHPSSPGKSLSSRAVSNSNTSYRFSINVSTTFFVVSRKSVWLEFASRGERSSYFGIKSNRIVERPLI